MKARGRGVLSLFLKKNNQPLNNFKLLKLYWPDLTAFIKERYLPSKTAKAIEKSLYGFIFWLIQSPSGVLAYYLQQCLDSGRVEDGRRFFPLHPSHPSPAVPGCAAQPGGHGVTPAPQLL